MYTIDILMITYNRPAYTRLSLTRLLETCDSGMRVWIWHNGEDEETLNVVREVLGHPRVFQFHHSVENKKLREPTNWFFQNSTGDLLTKVDDDCLMPFGWADTLRQAHIDNERFGAVGCWRFQDEDFNPEVAHKKIQEFGNGHRLLLNCWVEGSGYLMKRACLDDCGPIRPGESFTRYCIRLAERGWINGWYYPFLNQEHMDDPRSPNTQLKTDEDLARWAPLTSQTFGAVTLQDWEDIVRADAAFVQRAPVNPKRYGRWRMRGRRTVARIRGLFSSKSPAGNNVSC